MSKSTNKNALDAELNRLLRRVSLLRDVARGSVELRTITVHRKKMSWTVNAKTRTYERHIAPSGWKKP